MISQSDKYYFVPENPRTSEIEPAMERSSKLTSGASDFISSIIQVIIENVIPEKPKKLTLERAGMCLKIIGKIWNLSEHPPSPGYFENICCETPQEKLMDMEGYVDEYQYLHIEAVNLNVTDISVIPKHFIWLLSADLSGNRLTNSSACPMTKLPNLVALKLNRNRIEDPYLPPMKHLQYLALSGNKIKSLHRIYHPNLETLNLNDNFIQHLYAEDCWKHTKLKQLELRSNQLTTTAGIEYTSLVNLYLAENRITELKGLEILVNLERLHLRGNQLTDLSGFSPSNINLKYLNLRENLIQTVEELKNLSVLKGLKELVIKGNIFNPEKEKRKHNEEDESEDEDIEDRGEYEGSGKDDDDDSEEQETMRVQILTYIPTLIRIDKKLISKEEKYKMKELLME